VEVAVMVTWAAALANKPGRESCARVRLGGIAKIFSHCISLASRPVGPQRSAPPARTSGSAADHDSRWSSAEKSTLSHQSNTIKKSLIMLDAIGQAAPQAGATLSNSARQRLFIAE